MPQISWYMEIAETTTSLPSPISEHRSRNVETTSSNPDHAKKLKKFRLLHSGEEFGISIDAYKVKNYLTKKLQGQSYKRKLCLNKI